MRLVEIVSADGHRLVSAIAGRAEDELVIELESVSSKGTLLGYYFGRGRRDVLMRTGSFQLRGRLRTRFDQSRRRWWFQARPAAALPAPGLSRNGAEAGTETAGDAAGEEIDALPGSPAGHASDREGRARQGSHRPRLAL